MNLVDFIAEAARRHGQRTAFKLGDRQLSFENLDKLSNGLARNLVNLGIKPGDRVALLLENSPDFPICYFGIAKAGAIAIPLDTKYKILEIKAVFDHCRPAALIAETAILKTLGGEFARFDCLKSIIGMGCTEGLVCIPYSSLSESSDAPPEVAMYSELAHIAYTSGPTLRPHGAEITQEHLIEAAAGSAAGFAQTEADTVILFALPLHHTIGIAVIMMTSLWAGSRVVIVNGVSMDAALCAIEKERATMFHGVPFIHAMMVNHLKTNGLKFNLSTLRFCGSAGAPIPVNVITDFEELTGKNLVQYYGLTESTSHVTCQEVTGSGRSGGVGRAIPGFSIRVVRDDGSDAGIGEPGEVIIKGPIMKAYHQLPELTGGYIRSGWLYTDDIGVIDRNGELFIKGIKKPMLITKGQNIYFSDISDLLVTHPSIAEAAAVGIPDPDGMRGEVVLAVVKLKDGADMTEQEVKKYCLEKLANYKCPKKVLFVAEIPRKPGGDLDAFGLLD
ncbi:class I adenylate-forming enzyme family protein [Dehalogenimonas alkenigignens]|uniref:Acyl-CoA synthetases (AMP-forming)/AMP-acid ligases II n=1 Tax=Dehalogenimonas alkenigignens TaxID=1217799 RepID=A0A0W0GIQ7_9CHLR|nr:AMP-binding protein [Dehalogenimonas alkenigignens]KTB48442.1 Acyl-CoA synthetases (AMP-forming)/AMP-acid ligases II [Dehalogenimonas alkenigignens]PVV85104.1 long-chain fatty acid--CoA ligase [Dehalogenimonas alkenigignens]